MERENSLFTDQEKTHLSLVYFNNIPNDYYILGGGLYQNGEKPLLDGLIKFAK